MFFALQSGPSEAQGQAPVDPRLLAGDSAGTVEFLVYLKEQADLRPAAALHVKREKGAYVYARLTEMAERTQAPLRALLAARGAEFRPYWVSNMIWVRGSPELVQELARRSEVGRIAANPSIQLELPEPAAEPSAAPSAGVEWNIQQVNAPQVWQAGYTGQGVVVAGQDTGYQWDHPALKRQYRGWNGSSADHNYNWHDAIHSGNANVCGFDSPAPCDDYGHGTHTMGTMVGDDGAGTQIGMAPGARWIGCRNMNGGAGTPATYTECFQWLMAPTDLSGNNPRPDLAPDVINNSWGCPEGEGCTSWDSLQTVVENTRAAGILVVASAGNYGRCGTIIDPPAPYDASFTVGSTGLDGFISRTSSRGPVQVNGSTLLKPDVVAPGAGINSSWRNSGYSLSSGTSMAAPHAAGLAALLLSAYPDLSGNVDAIEDLMRGSAVQPPEAGNCGSPPGNTRANYTYGWGRIDAWAAYNGRLNIRLYFPSVIRISVLPASP